MTFSPMLAKAAEAIPESADFTVETKLDGWRATYFTLDGFKTRTNKSITATPYLIQPLVTSLPANTILDGEIVDLDAHAGKQWNRTQSILSANKVHEPGGHLNEALDPPLSYVIFDVIELEGKDLTAEPLRARQQLLPLLERLIDTPYIKAVQKWPGDTPNLEAIYEQIVEEGYEGVVCKRLDSRYVQGSRDGNWLKVKPEKEMEVEVTGTYPPEPGSKYENKAVGGITFRTPEGYEGRCAGMDDELRVALHLEPANYIGRVAEVRYAQVGDAGALRFPRFKRFRDPADKKTPEQQPEPEAATPVANSNAAEANMILLERAMDAERERDKLAEQNERIQERLEALLGKSEEGLQQSAPLTPPATKTRRTGATAGGGPKRRNYKAMSAAKLRQAVVELRTKTGDSYHKAVQTDENGGWSVSKHLQEAEASNAERGLPPIP